ncbi:radical SAM protein [uncultured Acidaminococcus sp.]|jgi:putative pyruvate formate lyase activating enzyme|uniref:radical SAM protein n=1 Tax=uncultured Acidaminococcus sp. TaxID=352152 RepID=UPI0025908081|nr:radical SAM protein [uncultured Acidaminococcus sp.]
MTKCTLCPHECGVERPETSGDPGQLGWCRMPWRPRAARAALHLWEEPCISGTSGGSGTVFFSGCTLQCVFCQNSEISSGGKGWEVTADDLRRIYQNLIAQGAHNINLVTPTHFLPTILESLEPKLPVPVVYNCGGYEKVETLRRLEGKVQIYLPDLKYVSEKAAWRYSHAKDYFAVATSAIREMFRQTGPYEMDEGTGLLKKGVIIRHMILPGLLEDSKRIIDWVGSNFGPGQVLFSLMRQYVPCGLAQEGKYPEIGRPLTEEEYQEVEDYLFQSPIEDGFVQEASSADSQFIPAFDGTGVKGE